MLKILCDETWTVQNDFRNVKTPTIVFYGVLLEDSIEESLLQTIQAFKERRGLLTQESIPVEIKWDKVEREWKGGQKNGSANRYEEFLDIFFNELAAKRLSFGYMFMDKRVYDRAEKTFLEKQNDNRHNFFFMLYFQFLYHCFIKNQVRQEPCEIWIDNRDMGAEDRRYRLGKLAEILNRRIYKSHCPKFQIPLLDSMGSQIHDSIRLVTLAESKDSPLVQLADLCAGCIRYIIEKGIIPPLPKGQMSLFQTEEQREIVNGKDSLSNYFYVRLRAIQGYDDLNICNESRHYRFNIFPFRFRS